MTTLQDMSGILRALEIENLSSEEQEELLLDLGDLVFRGSMLRFIERMDDATRESFNTLLDRNASEQEITDFLQKHIPNADAVVEETLADLRSDILAVTS